jgi:soluble lytic murein transglycosylase-like protein
MMARTVLAWFFLMMAPTLIGLPVCAQTNLEERTLKAMAEHMAARHDIPFPLFSAIITHESRWRHDVRGSHGEVGLTQVLPQTFQRLQRQGLVKGDPAHPVTNLEAGAVYLRQVMSSFTELELANAQAHLHLMPLEVFAASYNWGPDNLKRAILGFRMIPSSVRAYARRITALLDEGKGSSEKSAK